MDSVDRRTSRPTFDFESELQNERIDHESRRASNPYNSADSFERRIPGAESSPSSSDRYHDLTLGQYILDRVGDAFKGLFRNSQTILRVDLRQALRYDVPLQRTPLKAKPRVTRQQPNRRENGVRGGCAIQRLVSWTSRWRCSSEAHAGF